MTTILNVAIAGASGALGSAVLSKLVATPHLNVRVLRNLGSKSVFPPAIQVTDVDYSSTEELTRALADQHALVSTVGAPGISGQLQLIDACIAAGVNRFIPSDFGVDLENPNAQKLPLFIPKARIHQYLVDKCNTTGISYTYIYTGSFLDWGFKNNMSFDVLSDTPTIVGDGNLSFSGILLPTTGEAVVGVLNNLVATKNRAVFVRDFITTQNQPLAMARRIAPERHYNPVHAELDDLQDAADDRLAQGLYDMETFRPYIYRAMFDPAYRREPLALDNQLLRISEKSEADLEEAMKAVLG
ncbi:hypothetical protein NW762_014100 [Fusarium torreyae]|uniref:NmrA-like domain-containing protein n=1 Tax=Fusarium torreyae TaxID=1237075 RepID=A0A9W8RM73_9HYPO|nr:hypothetical protein NW762_014100 [Fusarium torreyae]